MDKLVLYHGSETVVRTPCVDLCKPRNDYGRGFYCTRQAELAREWACQEGRDGFANEYWIDASALRILDINDEEFCILHWLAILLEHRIFTISTSTMQRGSLWLDEHFSVDLSDADIVKGYRADDSYFGFARAFLRNEITLDQLSRAMHLGELGEQYMIKSERAFDTLEFVAAEPVDSTIYWAKRAARDERARRMFHEIVNEPPSTHQDGLGLPLYISTLMMMEEDELNACLR